MGFGGMVEGWWRMGEGCRSSTNLVLGEFGKLASSGGFVPFAVVSLQGSQAPGQSRSIRTGISRKRLTRNFNTTPFPDESCSVVYLGT
jgi:hypothetical protein